MIKTARISEKVEGIRLDITIKNSPKHVLAPTWDLVMGLKNSKITWEQYESGYLKLLNERLKTRRAEFVSIIEMSRDKDVYLICFCPDERICHRRLAKEFFVGLVFDLAKVKA